MVDVPNARTEGPITLEQFNAEVRDPIAELLKGATTLGDLSVGRGDYNRQRLAVGADGVPIIGGPADNRKPIYGRVKRAGMPPGVLLHRGAWSAAATYETQDVVSDGGATWRRSGAPVTGGTSPSGGGSGWSIFGGSTFKQVTLASEFAPGTVLADVTGMSLAVTVPLGAYAVAWGFSQTVSEYLGSPASYGTDIVRGSGAGTSIGLPFNDAAQNAWPNTPGQATMARSGVIFGLDAPGAGEHTYKLRSAANAGTARITAAKLTVAVVAFPVSLV